MTYNLIIIENKFPTGYLNLGKKAFFETLWTWTYTDDLWDFIREENPSEEYLLDYIDTFIYENMFHMYEDDDLGCVAFTVQDNLVSSYSCDKDLINFILEKINEHERI